MSSRSRVEFDEREYYSREGPRRREREDVDVRIIERDRDRVPAFLREDRRPEAGQLVLRQREVETSERRRRSPSPVRVRETRIMERARSVSPGPPRRTEEDIRFRTVVREPSRGPDIERLRTRIVERERSLSPSPPPVERVRARIVERNRSPSPVRERIRIVERERERPRSRTPSPPPQPQVIKGPVIEREVITHYRDIDHGIVSVRPPSPPPAIRHKERERERERERDTEIDIYTSRNETEVDIHKHASRSRGRHRSPSRERVSHKHHTHSYDDDVIVQADRNRLHVDVDTRRSTSRGRRAHSAAPAYHEYDDEAQEITTKIDSRGRMGEAWNGITKDWTIVDVPPGTERVRMDGAGGASAEVTWQKYSGVRRSKFIADRDEKSTVVSSSTSVSDREVSDSRRESRLSVAIYDKDKEIDIEKTVDKRQRRSDMWTEITKDLVIREAIEEMGYEYEETDYFFYIMSYLRYEDVLQLVQLSDAVRRARKDRVTEIQWERGYQDEWDREYRIHSHHHDHGGRRKRYEDDRTEISYEHRGSRSYHR